MSVVSLPRPKTLTDLAVACQCDPLQYVCCAYSWGQGLLLEDDGPDDWQVDVLEHMKEALLDPDHEGAIRIGVASGHGIGKGALSAWIIQWFMTCRPRPQIVVTANTESQLLTKTWRELAKWHNLSLFKEWFEWTKTAYYKRGAEESWFAAAIPWNEKKSEAFQGTHDRYVLMLEDESSAIADSIHDAIEGSMTTPQALWLKFGNPTRNTGRFKEIFAGGRFAHRWWTRQIDSRTCRKTDKAQIAQWIEDYGEDSDFVRVRVKGQFPRAGSTQFIGDDLIVEAKARALVENPVDPIILGADIARFGDDRTVIRVRQGGALLAKRVYREKDTVQVAGYIAEMLQEWQVDAAFVDADGVGGGSYDQLVHLGYPNVFPVHSASTASDPEHYANKRAEMWARYKQWLKDRGHLDADERDLIAESTSIEYGYDIRGRLQMEKKIDMKRRHLASPDEADAVVLTFAEPVAPKQLASRPEDEERGDWGMVRGGWMAG